MDGSPSASDLAWDAIDVLKLHLVKNTCYGIVAYSLLKNTFYSIAAK